MKTKLGIIFLILLFSCNVNKHITDKKSDCEEKSFKSKFIDKDSLGIPYYQSDAFSAAAINGYTIESVKKKYSAKLKLTHIPIINSHYSTIIDTIYKFSNNHNLIEFYRAQHADFVIKIDVTDDIFKLGKCICVGFDKDKIIKTFGIKENIGDTIMIGDLEKNLTFTFYFKKNRITRIVSYSYLD